MSDAFAVRLSVRRKRQLPVNARVIGVMAVLTCLESLVQSITAEQRGRHELVQQSEDRQEAHSFLCGRHHPDGHSRRVCDPRAQGGEPGLHRHGHQLAAHDQGGAVDPGLAAAHAHFRTADDHGGHPAEREDALKAIKSRLEILAKQRATYEAQISEAEEKLVYEKFSKSFATYLEIDKKLAEISGEGKKKKRAIFKGDSNKTFRSMLESMDEIIKINDAGSTRSDQAATDVFNAARAWIIGLLAAIVVIAFGWRWQWPARCRVRSMRR
jgi:hypothetical protein